MKKLKRNPLNNIKKLDLQEKNAIELFDMGNDAYSAGEQQSTKLSKTSSNQSLQRIDSSNSSLDDALKVSMNYGNPIDSQEEEEDDDDCLYYSEKKGIYLTREQMLRNKVDSANSDTWPHKTRKFKRKLLIPIATSVKKGKKQKPEASSASYASPSNYVALLSESPENDKSPWNFEVQTPKKYNFKPNDILNEKEHDDTSVTSVRTNRNESWISASAADIAHFFARSPNTQKTEFNSATLPSASSSRRKFLPSLVQMKSLFSSKSDKKQETGLGVPLLECAMQAPLLYFTKDDLGRRCVPVVFAALKVQLRVLHSKAAGPLAVDDQNEAVQDEPPHLSYRTDVYQIHCTYGPLQWVVNRKLIEFLQLHLTLSLRSRFTKSLPPLPGFLRKQFVSLVQEAKQKTKDALSKIESKMTGYYSYYEPVGSEVSKNDNSPRNMAEGESPEEEQPANNFNPGSTVKLPPELSISERRGSYASDKYHLSLLRSPAVSIASNPVRKSSRAYSSRPLARSLSPDLRDRKKSRSWSRSKQKLLDINEQRRIELEGYLNKTLRILNMKASNELCTFLGLSRSSLLPDGEPKGAEGFIKLRARRFRIRPACLRKIIPNRYKRMWISVKDNYVAISSQVSHYPARIMSIDKHFTVTRPNKGRDWTWKRPWRFGFNREKLVLGNEFRKWVIKPDYDKFAFDEIRQKLQDVSIGEQINAQGGPIVVLSRDNRRAEHNKGKKNSIKSSGAVAASTALATSVVAATVVGVDAASVSKRLLLRPIKSSDKFKFDVERAMGSFRFDSFAPTRHGCACNFYIDAEGYYRDVEAAILSAKRSLYIADWWLSPELYLRRPSSMYPESRIDLVLKKAAEAGVKVFIIVYKEVQLALTINSAHTKQVFENLHPNICILRHPDHPPGGVLYWALHEKYVIVDSETAFMGGIDLCFGRYDNTDHKIGDFWSAEDENEVFPGQDYSNPRIRDFRNVRNHEQSLIDRKEMPRMAWHDVAVCFYGQPARDLGNHFVQRWNWIKYIKANVRQEIPYLYPMAEFTSTDEKDFLLCKEKPEWKGNLSIQLLRSAGPWNMGLLREKSILSAYIHLIKNAQRHIYIENQFFISSTKSSNASVKNKISETLALRIIRAHEEMQNFRVIIVLPILPAFEGSDFAASEASTIRIVMQYTYLSISRSPTSLLARLRDAGIGDWQRFIGFYGLRTIDTLDRQSSPDKDGNTWVQNLVSEQIYVHSKIMLVDDKHAIVGSANINDRSMQGSRDAEVAAIISCNDASQEVLSFGEKVFVVPFVYQFRMTLMKEHLGYLGKEDAESSWLSDFACDESWSRIQQVAATNTSIFDELFQTIPKDSIYTWAQYKDLVNKNASKVECHLAVESDRDTLLNSISKIQGTLVLFSLNFLCKEDLAENGAFNKNNFVNEVAFI